VSKTVSVHQPNFLPWLGYFYKIAKSDVFVILNNVQYIKRSFINRSKIKTPTGEQYLTLPIFQKGKYKQLISECVLYDKEKSTRKIMGTIRQNYAKAKYFKDYFEQIQEILDTDITNLSEINILLIKWSLKILDIQTEIKILSELENIIGGASERIVSICKNVGADEYLSGFGGNKYQEKEVFDMSGIKLRITDFQHPVYSQCWGEFLPNLSIIDLLFNYGPESKKILLGK